MADENTNRILANFTTDSLRPLVVIDSVRYEVKQRDDFGLRDFVRLQALKSQVYEKMIRDVDGELTPDDVSDIEKQLREFVRLVMLECPDDVIDKLKDTQKLKIVELFNSELERTMPQPPAQTNRAARRSTSTTSSRRSRASTAEGRTTG